MFWILCRSNLVAKVFYGQNTAIGRKSSFPLHESTLGFAVWRRGIVGTRLFTITSCCEHDYFMFGLTGLMVSENVQQQDPIGFTWCTGNWDRRLLTCNPIQEDNWAQPQSNTVPKLHVIHSAKLSHQQWTLPLHPKGPPRLSQEHFNSLYLACCWAHYPLIHIQAEHLSSSKRIGGSCKAHAGAMQLRPEKLSHNLDPILLFDHKRIRKLTLQD